MKPAFGINIFFYYFFIGFSHCEIVNYTRDLLQDQFPGFGTKFLLMPDDNSESTVIGYLTEPDEETQLKFANLFQSDKPITFTLYTRQDEKGFEMLNASTIGKSTFDPKRPTKFVTHGWMSSGTADNCVFIKNAFLQRGDFNVFVLDWSQIADNPIYPVPMARTADVADIYSSFINDLIDNANLDPNNVHMVGHSLGAHISGFAARDVKKGKIARVTALDPALPGFNNIQLVEGKRISKTDAQFVDVIHTCAGYLGYKDPLGHADFYPNGGSPPQPGCGHLLEMVEACSHGRSWRLFAESIKLNKEFLASPCENFAESGEKTDDPKCLEMVPMGYPAPPTARGQFYLRTSDKSPFLLNFIDSVENIL